MATGAPQVFHGITPDAYARLIQKANASGIALSGNSGTASKLGVEVAWNYSAELQQLTLQCLKSSLFFSTQDVNEKLQSLVKKALTTA